MDTATSFHPCWRSTQGYRPAARGYRTEAAAARAIPVLNYSRRRFGSVPYTHIAAFGEGDACLRLARVEQSS